MTAYIIPISSLKQGVYTYNFLADDQFFKQFEGTLIEKAQLEIKLALEKKSALFELFFEISGNIATTCDRCLEFMQLPVEEQHRLLVKFSDTLEDDLEVSYIPMGSQDLDVSTYIYEFAHLCIPMVKTHEDVDEDCPVDLEDFLEDDPSENDSASIWDALKDINLK
ncbi:MAG: DUF177 domain-containing protein [Bacteroidota bacterium]